MFDNTEMQAINEHYETDDNSQLLSKQKLNYSYNVDMLNINNLLHGELSKTIPCFDKMNINEMEPTTQNINETTFEEDLGIMIDELVNITFSEINEGKGSVVRKQHFFNYFDDHKVNLQEIYKWLLNNQADSNSI